MTRLLGKGEGRTVVILTDAESRLMRDQLESACVASALSEQARGRWKDTLAAFNRGVARGTERIKGEFAELQAEQKAREEDMSICQFCQQEGDHQVLCVNTHSTVVELRAALTRSREFNAELLAELGRLSRRLERLAKNLEKQK